MILNLTFLAIFVVTDAEKHTDDVWTVRLRNCRLDYHTNIHALALACPGVDYIKLWPQPVQQTWQETPDPWPGRYARR